MNLIHEDVKLYQKYQLKYGDEIDQRDQFHQADRYNYPGECPLIKFHQMSCNKITYFIRGTKFLNVMNLWLCIKSKKVHLHQCT